MFHRTQSAPAIPSISRQITRIFVGLLLFTNALLGLLLYFQFDQHLTRAWSDRYHVPLGHLAQEIDYGLQLGFSLETMENLPNLLTKTTQRYPELTHLFVSDRQGRIIAHTPAQKSHHMPITPLLANLGKGDINGALLTNDQGAHILVWSINDPFGDTSGFVFMEPPWTELELARNAGLQRLILGISGVIGSFLLLSIGLFQLICRSLERNLDALDDCTEQLLAGETCTLRHGSLEITSAVTALVHRLGRLPTNSTELTHSGPSTARPKRSSFQTRILTGALGLLLGSSVASTTVGYFVFHDLYLPMLYSQSRIIGQSLGDLVREMHAHGIPVQQMRGMSPIFTALIGDFPQIAAIGLYDAKGQLLQSAQQDGNPAPPVIIGAKGLDDPFLISVPISYGKTLIGMIRLGKVPNFFARRLFDIALDVLALLVVSILMASELLVFIVRFLVAVPIDNLLRALRGEPAISPTDQGILPSAAIQQIEQKIQILAAQAPAIASVKEQTSPVATSSSPLMPYVRPPMFLVVFADALSLSFFPLYVSTLIPPAGGWLSKELLMSLPISAFMLVWAISLPIVGQWSDV